MAKKKKMTLEEKLEEAIVNDAPYEVPENWCWVNLEDISSVISKGTTPKGGKSAYIDSGVKFLRVENIDDCGYINTDYIKYVCQELHLNFLKRSILVENDILISIAGTLGKTAIVRKKDLPLNTNQAIAFIRLLDIKKILPQYVKLFLSNPETTKELLSQTKVTAIPNLTLEIIGKCRMPLPPLKEQQRIVDRIESLFEKLDKAKELIEEARDGFEKRKATILEKAFRGELTKELKGINNNNKFEFNVEISENEKLYISKLPTNWNVCRINHIAKVKGGKRLPKGESLVKENTGYPYLRAGNLKNGTVLEDNIEYLTKEVMDKIKNYTISSDDVYITIVGACIGDVGIIPNHLSGSNLTENAAKICDIKKEIVNKTFLMKWLSSLTGQYFIKGNILSATLGKLALNRIKEILIPIPPIEEQKEIVRILDNLLEEESKIEELTQLEDQIELIKKSILAKAFRGELGTNCEEDESALGLLKEILSKQ